MEEMFRREKRADRGGKEIEELSLPRRKYPSCVDIDDVCVTKKLS